MIARELIADIIPPVETTDTIQKVLERMSEFRVNHLPIVSDKTFIGLVSDEDFIEIPDYNTTIANVNLSLNNVCINQGQHIYDVIRLFYDKRLTLIPVLEDNKHYLGVISINAMVEHFAKITSVKEPGGILILEVNNRNNSLAHIAQIVESNNAQILSSYVNSFSDSTKLEITLKINRTDLSAIVAAFTRYDYDILATFNDAEAIKGNAGRYDQLMNYLNI